MSSSEKTMPPVTAGDNVSSVVADLEQLVDSASLSPEQVRAIVSAATRLYAAASSRAGEELPPVGPEVSRASRTWKQCKP